MIDRYTLPQMGRIWEPKRKFETWLDIEVAACEAWAKLGKIPKKDLKTIKEKAAFDIEGIDEIEKIAKHDVIAFLTNVAGYVGPPSRFIHMGLTSSDILDTSLALLLREASDIIISDIERLMDALKKRAYEFKDTLMIGRTHGMHSEPITFGLKLCVWYDEMRRNLERMKAAKEIISTGKISGAVGTFAGLDPRVEEIVMKKLGLKPAPASTQIVQRDRHAQYFTTLAVIASSVEKFAVEIRHLQRTEVAEAMEFFSPGQKGSSAMPHKRNPVLSENITGLSRIIRANSLAALENVPLWHERDISHSSPERVIAPDSTILANFILTRFLGVIEKLVVDKERMKKNMDSTGGLVFSQRLMLTLVEKGITREESYAIVQGLAREAWDGDKNFIDLVKVDPKIKEYFKAKDVEAVFDPKYFVRHTDFIFKRVFSP
jgi:adenylosuccinate lyase